MTSGNMDATNRRRCLIQDTRRLADVEEKHRRVRELLSSQGADAALFQDPATISWFTGGADPSRLAVENCQTSVFVTEDARLFATNAVDSSQLFERECFGLGFQLKQREWFQPHAALIEDLCRGRRVVSDCGMEGTRNLSRRLSQLRQTLTPLEIERLRRLSRVLVHAVEVTAGNIRRGVTEAAVAGELSNRLIRRTVTPVRIQVCADGRNIRYRHWTYGEDPVESYATVSCVARRWGLHVAVSRTVCLDRLSTELLESHQKAVLMHATGIYFSRSGSTLGDVWKRVRRIYDKFNLPSEWQLCDQADVIGYRVSEQQLTPASDFRLTGPMALYWHPTAGAAMPGDTILLSESGCEILTRSSVWPELKIHVKGHEVPAAGILVVRHAESERPADTSNDALRSSNVPDDAYEGESGDDLRMDSIWELDLPLRRSVFDDSESQYSEESVLDG